MSSKTTPRMMIKQTMMNPTMLNHAWQTKKNFQRQHSLGSAANEGGWSKRYDA
jgi:hypothetical protein